MQKDKRVFWADRKFQVSLKPLEGPAGQLRPQVCTNKLEVIRGAGHECETFDFNVSKKRERKFNVFGILKELMMAPENVNNKYIQTFLFCRCLVSLHTSRKSFSLSAVFCSFCPNYNTKSIPSVICQDIKRVHVDLDILIWIGFQSFWFYVFRYALNLISPGRHENVLPTFGELLTSTTTQKRAKICLDRLV